MHRRRRRTENGAAAPLPVLTRPGGGLRSGSTCPRSAAGDAAAPGTCSHTNVTCRAQCTHEHTTQRPALHDALTHDQPARPRAAAQMPTKTGTSAATSSTARPDPGPWLTLVVLGLVIVAAMLTITVTWN